MTRPPRSTASAPSGPEPPLEPFHYLGPALRRLRVKRGLEQAETARMSGVTKAMMCGYEKRGAKPSLGSLAKILAALRTDLGELHREMEQARLREEGMPEAAPETVLPDLLQALARSLEETSQQMREAIRR
ncbi:MAG TPA: helix-turn-helix transcriptional regulator [Thermoanaerobaculia bacterium]|nr:helix-turn-helix transcriptional regulator [Thermoanaerobaculia bacterium]